MMMMMMITGILDNKDYVINKRTHTLGDFFLHTVGVFSALWVIFSVWWFFPRWFFPGWFFPKFTVPSDSERLHSSVWINSALDKCKPTTCHRDCHLHLPSQRTGLRNRWWAGNVQWKTLQCLQITCCTSAFVETFTAGKLNCTVVQCIPIATLSQYRKFTVLQFIVLFIIYLKLECRLY